MGTTTDPRLDERYLVDLHAHYPIHLRLLPKTPESVPSQDTSGPGLWDKIRALILKSLNNHDNFPAPNDPAVTVDNLYAGNVGVILSVLYEPFDEMDLAKSYGAPPEGSYFTDLVKQLEEVECDIRDYQPEAVVAHDTAELAAAVAAQRLALIHAVEGGFQLGSSEGEVQANLAELARRGVAYVTLAHLFWRQVATNAPAIPFLPDWVYRWWFPEPADPLAPLGKAAIRAMVANRILIDVTHMSEKAIGATLDMLDAEYPRQAIPVVATHGAYRFGSHEYNLTDKLIQRIAARDGVIGLIACEHWMTDGLDKTKTFDDTFEVLYQHIEKIASLTGGYRNVAIGSDLDGFIRPSMPGLERPQGYKDVRARLEQRYADPSIPKAIFSDNALRLLEYWGEMRGRGRGDGGIPTPSPAHSDSV
jgi:microsomal dipeptidase-like Zn-dependent dipeptidase